MNRKQLFDIALNINLMTSFLPNKEKPAFSKTFIVCLGFKAGNLDTIFLGLYLNGGNNNTRVIGKYLVFLFFITLCIDWPLFIVRQCFQRYLLQKHSRVMMEL